MRRLTRSLAAATLVVVLILTAACSSSGGGSTSTTGKKPVGSFTTLTGKTTTVIFTAGFLKALKSLRLTPASAGKSNITKQHGHTVAIFPITGGNATIYRKADVTPYVQGVIDHAGSGLTLRKGKTGVTIANFVIHPGNNSSLTGDLSVDGGVALHGIKLFDLDGTTLRTPAISGGGVASLSGTGIYLSAEAAATLNGVFGTDALAGDQKVKVGVAVIRATGK